MRLKPGGVGSGMFDHTLFLRQGKCLAKQLMLLLRLEQSGAGFLQRGVMGDLLEADGLAELRVVLQERDDAAIVLLLMSLEHQACKELRLGILLGCKTMGVCRQLFLSGGIGHQQHLPWRFAGGRHAHGDNRSEPGAPPDRCRTSDAFLQSPFSLLISSSIRWSG